MAQFGLKYSKVWKVKTENGYTKLDLSDSKKNPKSETGYDNCTWFNCILLGNAKDFKVKEGDKVNVEGQIFSSKSEKDGKFYTNIAIFGICFSEDSKTETPKKPNKMALKDVKVDLDLDIDFPFD